MPRSLPILSGFQIFADQTPGKPATIKGHVIDWDGVDDASPLPKNILLQSIQGNTACLLVGDISANGDVKAREMNVVLGAAVDNNAIAWAQYIEKHPEHISPFYAFISPDDQSLDLTNFRGVIENWSPARNGQGDLAIAGMLLGHEGSISPRSIDQTSAIVAREGNLLVTKSGSRYALGTSKDGNFPNAKAQILESLPEVADAPTPRHAAPTDAQTAPPAPMDEAAIRRALG